MAEKLHHEIQTMLKPKVMAEIKLYRKTTPPYPDIVLKTPLAFLKP